MKDSIVVTPKSELVNLIEETFRKFFEQLKETPQEFTDEIFTVIEASQFLRLAPQTLYSFTSKKTIPFFKRGKRLYFKKSELEQWIIEGKQRTYAEMNK